MPGGRRSELYRVGWNGPFSLKHTCGRRRTAQTLLGFKLQPGCILTEWDGGGCANCRNRCTRREDIGGGARHSASRCAAEAADDRPALVDQSLASHSGWQGFGVSDRREGPVVAVFSAARWKPGEGDHRGCSYPDPRLRLVA